MRLIKCYKKKIYIILILIILVIIVISFIRNQYFPKSRKLTNIECTKKGGLVWRANSFDAQICPDCDGFLECRDAYDKNNRETCSDCGKPFQDCLDQFPTKEACSICNNSCESCIDSSDVSCCANIINECEKCSWKNELNIKNCPAVKSCNSCRENKEKLNDLSSNCPMTNSCTSCWEKHWPYPKTCPSGKNTLGVISDRSLMSLCCK